MDYPSLLSKFPFPEIRPVQEAALQVIVEAKEREKRFTLLELPTGSGKSPLSIAVGRSAPSYILTSQNNLLTQMMGDFGKSCSLVDLRGKSNYTCIDHHPVDCGLGVELNKDQKVCFGCPYRMAKETFIRAPMGVTNYTYYLSESRYVGQLEPREYLICDEAHNIENEVLSMVGIEITKNRAEELDTSIPRFTPGHPDQIVDWLARDFIPAAKARIVELTADIDKHSKEGEDNKAVQTALRRRAAQTTQLTNITEYVDSPGENWFAWLDDKGALQIKPLSAASYVNNILFGESKNVILMSATMLDFKTFARSLGIPPKQATCYAAPSDFPKENRRIVYWPSGSMSYKEIANTLPLMVVRIEKILDKYADAKGIIHTHTYKIADQIADYLSDTKHRNRIITHTSMPGARERAIREHTFSEEPTILLSPSMSEGLDLKDELSRFQIVCKLAYPFLDPFTRERMERDPAWYQLRTALTLVQATGRSVRSKDDYAITVILDSAFEWFFAKNQHILPEWWKEAIEFK